MNSLYLFERVRQSISWIFIPSLIYCLFISSSAFPTSSSISGNFNAGALPAGDYLWFSLVVNPTTLPSTPVNVYAINGNINFTANATVYNIAIPDAQVTFQTPPSTPSTTFTSQWITSAPSNQSGNTFLAGVSFLIPLGGLPGSINNVTVSENFITDSLGTINLNWQWAAALYNSSMGTNYSLFGVSPADGAFKAGTPVNMIADFLGNGGTGGGGSNYTGSLSATKSVQPSLQVPEPTTYLLLGSTLLVAFYYQRQSRRQKTPVIC